VIKKPRERGGHSPRWAAETERERKIKIVINILSLCEVIDIIYRSLNLLASFLTRDSRRTSKSSHMSQYVRYLLTSVVEALKFPRDFVSYITSCSA
jgi:uncharacterized membrane protein